MKKLTIILFFLGIVLELCSFCLSQIKHMPWVLEIASPAYAQGMRGIEKLEANETLMPKDTGFSAISDVIMSSLLKSNSSELLNRIVIQKMEPVGFSGLKQGGKILLGSMKVNIIFSNNQEHSWRTEYLRTKLVEAHFNTLFVIACYIFGFGVVLQFCAFWMHVVKGKK